METKNLEWIRTFGNHLMGEFEELLYQVEGACQNAGIDLQNDGEKGRAAGISKYGFLEKSNVLLENLKEDYLNFAQVLGFDANTGGWDLPFDEKFKQVDIEMDNQVVDRYFDVNIRNAYRNIFNAKLMTKSFFDRTIQGRYFPCPCCRSSFFERNGSYEICPVCGWENDKVQNLDPTFKGGANKECLNDAAARFRSKHAGWGGYQ